MVAPMSHGCKWDSCCFRFKDVAACTNYDENRGEPCARGSAIFNSRCHSIRSYVAFMPCLTFSHFKWSYDVRSCERNFLQLRREAWKIQDFNGIWARDLAIPVRRSNQLSYEATDVGSWSFVGSNVPVRNESTMKWYMKWIIYELRIWNQVKLWSWQLWTQFLQLRREAWKFRTSMGLPVGPEFFSPLGS